jgi:long-chain fatty acid transport protein
MKKILSLSLAASLSLFAAAYKIPEQSARSVALAGAYVAAAKDADTSFYNPANMSFMDEYQYIEISLTGAFLPKVKYTGVQYLDQTTSIPASNKSKSEKFLIPHLHYVGPAFGKWRFGASITTPAGTSKRWSEKPQKWFSNKYTLRVAEFNPALSYKVSDNFSIGAGVRVVFTDGKIILDNPKVHYYLDGDVQTRFGYNVALSYKLNELTLATTYRSKVDLKEKGTAQIDDRVNSISLTSTGRVKVPLPAVWTVAAALEVNEKATFEVVYERTFWSSYKSLDITFDSAAPYNIHKPKNWNDTNTFRVGLTYKNSPKLTTMYGFAYDETPVPAKTLGYELPDNDALIFSLGAIYKLNDAMKIGLAYLYDYKLDRTIEPIDRNNNGIVGKFGNLRAHLLDLSFAYRF